MTWFTDWESSYTKTWYGKIVELESKPNVYSDIAYLSGEYRLVFTTLLEYLVNDARNGRGSVKDKHIIGTDWFMTEMDEMSPDEFWDRVQEVFHTRKHKTEKPSKDDADLWIKWSSTNALDWLNLKPRIDTLKAFYRKHNATPPIWWAKRLARYYDTGE